MARTKTDRRGFLFGGFRGTASAAVAGSAWGAWVQSSRAAPLVLRPPGALEDEARFAAACIKCGECVTACPYDTLSLADLASGAPVGTPHMAPRNTPCYMCHDVPCARVCPTGALDRDIPGIREARMGLAVVDSSTCLSMRGLRCEACHRACPLIDEALSLVYEHQTQTGKHAYFRPTVDPDICTGCGQCEHACVTDEPAIRVLPRGIAQGQIGEHYRLRDHELGEESIPPAEQPDRPSDGPVRAPGIDYLNDGVDL